MRPLVNVLVDESHRQAWSTRPEVAARMNPGNPADAGYLKAAKVLSDHGLVVTAHTLGDITPEALDPFGVLVLPHCSTDEWEATTWGGIFCDREAARFRAVTRRAADVVCLPLPPDAELLINNQDLTQQTFILWDLVHDRTHSHGDLPFDPFMIKQRMPYWMYALEELRCDLNTFRETTTLESNGVTLAPHVRYAILFDRLFRFPTTGSRVRNYDGLGGQILFAWLHKHGVLNWTDNALSIDWITVGDSVIELCEQVNTLYHDGIDRSRIGYWLAAHEFVSSLVPPQPSSVWAQGGQGLPTDRKAAVDAVLPDEFPLNVFYEALSRSLANTIESTKGITGVQT